jgi:hypothetical protein
MVASAPAMVFTKSADIQVESAGYENASSLTNVDFEAAQVRIGTRHRYAL